MAERNDVSRTSELIVKILPAGFLYQENVAYAHHKGFGELAEAAGPELLKMRLTPEPE